MLIICHDFAPLNSVAAHRPNSWYKYLELFGFKAVVVCRKWEKNITKQEDKFVQISDAVDVTKSQDKELHRIPSPASRRDKLILKYGMNKRVIQRKLLSLLEQFKSLLHPNHGEHYYLFKYCREYIKENPVDIILATGGPFDLFKYASMLSKETNIPWIADYRDEWEGNISLSDIAPWKRLLRNYLKGNEKKWTKNCLAFTSVSNPVIERISNRINKKGHLVRNGLDLVDLPIPNYQVTKQFTLTYAGTIYDTSYVETFITGLKLFITQENPSHDEFKLQLIGIQLNLTLGTDRFLKMTKEISPYLSMLPSMTHEDLMTELSSSNAFLNLVYGNIAKGMYAVKIFDYMALGKPIINIETVRPKKKHEFFEFMMDCYEPEDVCQALTDLYNRWKNDGVLFKQLPDSMLNEFDRKFQCGKLAEVLNTHI